MAGLLPKRPIRRTPHKARPRFKEAVSHRIPLCATLPVYNQTSHHQNLAIDSVTSISIAEIDSFVRYIISETDNPRFGKFPVALALFLLFAGAGKRVDDDQY
jgi:hypothetical protein